MNLLILFLFYLVFIFTASYFIIKDASEEEVEDNNITII